MWDDEALRATGGSCLCYSSFAAHGATTQALKACMTCTNPNPSLFNSPLPRTLRGVLALRFHHPRDSRNETYVRASLLVSQPIASTV